jgi:hypothetical protein
VRYQLKRKHDQKIKEMREKKMKKLMEKMIKHNMSKEDSQKAFVQLEEDLKI